MLSQAKSLSVFHSASDVRYKTESRGSSFLHRQAEIRSAFCRGHPFGAERFTTSHDAVYNLPRDAIPSSPREREACYVATMVDKWSSRLSPYNDLFAQIIKGSRVVSGLQPESELKFDKRWLESPTTFIARYFCTFQNLLSRSDPSTDKFRVSSFLGCLAHSKYGTIPLVHTLLALATSPALRDLQLPDYQSFDVSKLFVMFLLCTWDFLSRTRRDDLSSWRVERCYQWMSEILPHAEF